MPFDIQFTLRDRPTMPTTYGEAPKGCSRHHIVGQKYLQLLHELCRASGVASGTIERFAFKRPPDRPEEKMSKDVLEGWRNEVFRAFVWSPYDLFVGPAGLMRVFDPSSGVEQQRPLSFPEDRWLALKRIPQYFEDIGVNLDTLFDLPTGATAKWKLRPDKDTLAKELTDLIKGVAPALRGDYSTPPVHDLNRADWGWVKATDISNFKPRSREDVADIHKQFASKIVKSPGFDDALLNLNGFRFLLLSR